MTARSPRPRTISEATLAHAVLGYRKDGRPIYNIAGGSVPVGTDPIDPAGTPPAADPVDPAVDPVDPATSTAPITPEEHAKALARMQAADRAKGEAEKKANELEQRLRSFEDKDKTELEKAQRDAAEAAAREKAANEALKRERINNAFLMSNKFSWHNPERALTLLDLSDVTIDEAGKVTGLEKAIESLAKSDAYLLKAPDPTPGSDLPPSGQPTGGGGPAKVAKADRDKLLEKYPALRR